MNKILKIAHRGARGYEPENTLKSFQKALDLNADGIELDVHLSADGYLMVMHDETIDRMTNGKGFINTLSLSELKSFLIDGQYEIPILKEVFDLVDKKCLINIELKDPKTPSKVVALIQEYISDKNWNYDNFLVSSFDWSALKEVHELNSNIALAVLTEEDLDKALAFAELITASAINPDYQLLDLKNTKKIKEQGFLVFPWTVNKEEDILKIKSYNVDGIITDFPDKV